MKSKCRYKKFRVKFVINRDEINFVLIIDDYATIYCLITLWLIPNTNIFPTARFDFSRPQANACGLDKPSLAVGKMSTMYIHVTMVTVFMVTHLTLSVRSSWQINAFPVRSCWQSAKNRQRNHDGRPRVHELYVFELYFFKSGETINFTKQLYIRLCAPGFPWYSSHPLFCRCWITCFENNNPSYLGSLELKGLGAKNNNNCF